jgi:hypothetical protein
MVSVVKLTVRLVICVIVVGGMVSQAAALLSLPTPVATASTNLPTCTAPISATRGDGGYLTRNPNDSLERHLWQPRGGDIPFTIKVPSGFQNDATVRACFRWHQAEGEPQPFVDASARIDSLSADRSPTIIATVPDLPASPPRWKLTAKLFGADPNVIGSYTGIWLVPIADVRIMVIDKSGTINADIIGAVGVTKAGWALTLAIVSIIIVYALLSYFCRKRLPKLAGINPILRVVTTPNGYASLSQFQIVLWTFVVGTSVIYVMALSGELITITSGTLILLGISGTATLGSQFQSNMEDAKALAAATPVTVPALVAIPATAVIPSAAPTSTATAGTPPALHATSWSDLVISDGQIDVTRLQMLYFTLVIAAFVIMTVVSNYQIPEIPQSFLILMGISNGVYVAAKFNK